MVKTNSLNSPVRGRANNNRERRRPPNKFCRYCDRKKVYPEKYCGEWGYPSRQTCFNCVMLRDGEISFANEGKSRDIDEEEEEDENALKFPLTILDTANDIFVGQYNSRRKTQQAINRYQIKRRTKKLKLKKISVIYHDAADCRSDFTDRFRNTG